MTQDQAERADKTVPGLVQRLTIWGGIEAVDVRYPSATEAMREAAAELQSLQQRNAELEGERDQARDLLKARVTSDNAWFWVDGYNAAWRLLRQTEARAEASEQRIGVLEGALRQIAANEIEVYDEDLEATVLVSMHDDELSEIARAALKSSPADAGMGDRS